MADWRNCIRCGLRFQHKDLLVPVHEFVTHWTAGYSSTSPAAVAYKHENCKNARILEENND